MLRPAAATLVVLAALTAGCTSRSGASTSSLPVPGGAQAAVVVRVSDGDTVVLRGRGTGPLTGEDTRVRLLLVDTPELGEQQDCYGREAAQRTSELLQPGVAVRVEADEDPQDRFGRALLHVWTDDGVNVGQALLAEGYATVLQVEPNRRYLEAFEQVERSGREDGRGLWRECR